MKAVSDVKLNLLTQGIMEVIKGKVNGLSLTQVNEITIQPKETVTGRLEYKSLYLMFSVGSDYGTYVGLAAPQFSNNQPLTVDLINNGSYEVKASTSVACAISIQNTRSSGDIKMRFIRIS